MRKLILLSMILAMCSVAKAQQKQVLSAASSTCTTTSCLSVSVDQTQGGSTFTITANASGNTIQFEASGDGGTTWVALNVTPSNSTTAVTSSTSTGTWQANVAGYTNIRMRMSTLVGGTTTVSMIQSTASARAGGGGGGPGGGSITSCTTTGGVAFENGTNNTLTCGANLTWTPSAGVGNGALNSTNDPNNDEWAMQAISQGTITTNIPVIAFLGFSDATLNSPNTSNADVYGVSGQANAHGSGTYTGVVTGISATATFDGTGSVAELAGNAIEPNENSGGGTVTLSAGFDCGDQHGVSGTLNACFYAPNQGSGVNDYALYLAGGKAHSVGPIDSNGRISANSDGTHAGELSLLGNTTAPTIPANSFGFIGPNSASFTSWFIQPTSTGPAGASIPILGTTSSNISPLTLAAAGAGQVLAGATPAFTATPALGTDNSVAGTLQLANSAANAHTIFASGATTTNTLAGPATVPATNTMLKCTTASTTCTLASSSVIDNGTTVTSTDTGGYVAPVFVSSGTTAGFIDLPQGTTSAAVAPCNTATSICEQAPTSVTSYLVTKPGVAAAGLPAGTVSAAVRTENFTGSSAFHAGPITIGSGSSISATSLCSTTNCPAGDYDVAAYVEITTQCTTTGSYIVWLGWTDDGSAKNGSSTTTFFPFPLNGSGVPTTVGTIVPAAAGNYAQAHIFLHTTGAANNSLGSINYGTTAGACGSGGPMVGKLFLTVTPLS